MEGLTLGKVANAVQGKLMNVPRNRKITGVAIDSRQIRSGNLFAALEGTNVDGHDYVEAAINSGAMAGLCQKAMGKLPYIKVRNARKAVGDLAAAYRQLFPSLKVAAITGSSGKTVTKEMLSVILNKRSKVLESEGNYNNDLGLPLTLFNLSTRYKIAVVEMGMNAPGEIRRLAKIAMPEVGVITNIGDAHLGNFSSRRALASAKLELVQELDETGTAILNVDDPYLSKAAEKHKRVISFGMHPKADVRVVSAGVHLNGTHVVLAFENQKEEIRLKVLGVHQAWNAAAAVAASIAMGTAFDSACLALEGFRNKTTMRLELLRIGQHRVINDTYNSNPQSAAAALQLLAELPSAGKKYFIAGSMLELGSHSGEAHRELGHQAATLGVDGLVTVGSEARSIAVGARRTGGIRWISKLDAAEEVAKVLRPQLSLRGDLILVKGSRGVGLETVVEELRRCIQ